MTYRVGVDVGGTFTDLVAFDETEGGFLRAKIPTRPQEPAKAVLDGVQQFRRQGADIVLLVHASTIGTNLFLGQIHLRLPKTALLTTEGFRDVLEIGRQRRAELYNLFYERPIPLVPRRHRYGVRERMNSLGEVLEPLDEAQVLSIADELRREGVETVAICYLHSYRNPVHEERTCSLLRQRLKDTTVVLSSQVDPHYREYERTSTTVVNAMLVPVVSQYLKRLERDLRRMDVNAPIYVMQSSGGMATLRGACALPAAIIESGPAAGVVGAAFLARSLGLGDLLSFDMGGTTAKAGAVVGGLVQVVTEYEVAGKVHAGRIIKGSGYPVRFPFIDLAEVSAGGGTIAWIEGGALRVGPISAGADPGPVAYGRGGTEPTVTDCNLILGRLSSRGLLDGQMPLDAEAAREAIRRLARRVSLDPVQLAHGVLRIIHAQMVRALRLVSLERGYDPRGMTLVTFGGAGPMHAPFLADELGISRVLIPPTPGLYSALSLLIADVRRDGVRAILRPASESVQAETDAAFDAMSAELSKALEDDGFPSQDLIIQRMLELRYRGQSYELTVPTDRILEAMAAFHRRHEEVYGYMASDEPVEVVSARVAAYGKLPQPQIFSGSALSTAAEPTEVRDVFFDGWRATHIYRRDALAAGQVLRGPAVVEQYDSTIVVPPGWQAAAESTTGVLRLEREA